MRAPFAAPESLWGARSLSPSGTAVSDSPVRILAEAIGCCIPELWVAPLPGAASGGPVTRFRCRPCPQWATGNPGTSGGGLSMLPVSA